MKTKLPKTLINEYKNPDQWALDFKKARKRKPKLADFEAYFGVKLAARESRKHFMKVRSSRWEQAVIQFIEEYYPSIKISTHKRPLEVKGEKFKKEIDVLLEDLNIGFEIQDNATHSINSDFEKITSSQYKKSLYKRGPTYHEAKRTSANELGILLIDIWEDKILDVTFKHVIASVIESKLGKMNI